MLKTLTIPESVHLHFTCPAATPYEFTQLVLIILKKKMMGISFCVYIME